MLGIPAAGGPMAVMFRIGCGVVPSHGSLYFGVGIGHLGTALERLNCWI